MPIPYTYACASIMLGRKEFRITTAIDHRVSGFGRADEGFDGRTEARAHTGATMNWPATETSLGFRLRHGKHDCDIHEA